MYILTGGQIFGEESVRHWCSEYRYVCSQEGSYTTFDLNKLVNSNIEAEFRGQLLKNVEQSRLVKEQLKSNQEQLWRNVQGYLQNVERVQVGRELKAEIRQMDQKYEDSLGLIKSQNLAKKSIFSKICQKKASLVGDFDIDEHIAQRKLEYSIEKMERREKRSQYQREMSSLVGSRLELSRIKSIDIGYSNYLEEPKIVLNFLYH